MKNKQPDYKQLQTMAPVQLNNDTEKSGGLSVEDLTAIFVLSSLTGFGPQKFKELHANKLKPIDIISGRSKLPMKGKRADKINNQLNDHINKQKPICEQRAVGQITTAQRLGAAILTYDHPRYPRNVFQSNNPLPLLYARGTMDVLQSRNIIACVGSRQIRSPYVELHDQFAREACRLGFAIVSGFALGADTVGHKAAQDVNGQTICVMPSGLDRPFPPENKALWEDLLTYSGAVFVSEFSFGTAASTLTLRKRNKTIVSFAVGVLVSQSSKTGGAMNAFRFALEQRKPIATFCEDGNNDTLGNAFIGEVVSSPNTDMLIPPPSISRNSTRHRNVTRFVSTESNLEAYARWLQACSLPI